MSATATEERAALCAHCRLPVPGGDPAAVDPQFCCSGCETVYETLRGAGLGGEYYALRASFASPGDAGPARATDRSYEAYDRDAFAEEFVGTGPRGEATLDLLLEGVHCAACVWLVERLPALDDGVLEARLSVRDARVSLRYDPELTSPARMARALDGLGYPAHPPTRREGAELARAAERRHLMSMGVAAVCAGNAMLVAFALYSAGEGTADGIRRGIDPSHAALFRWVGLALGWLAILWPGRTFLRGAWAALRTRTPNLDLPISLALLAGAVAGTWTTVVGHGEAYFDSLTVLVLLLLVGRYVQ
ncbi:MAG: heavy metal translocating P-type ATPase metal-binding domain-containing protein, partial [Planctomycetota bacterium]